MAAAAASIPSTNYIIMKIQKLLITGTCMAALTLCLPIANAQTESPSPKTKASPTEKAAKQKSEKTDTATADKPARSIPFRGDVNEVDSDAKTFEIGKGTKRTLKVTDKTKINKEGGEGSFSDITAGTYVTGSYWKQEDGTLEARTVNVGGPAGKGKPASKKKKADAEDEGGEAEE
jgi:hypothetical protein